MFISNTNGSAYHKAEEPYWIKHKNHAYLSLLSVLNSLIDYEFQQSPFAEPAPIVTYANFTGRKVNVLNSHGSSKSYAPLNFDILDDPQVVSDIKNICENKFFIITLCTFKSTEKNCRGDKLINYIKHLRDNFRDKKDPDSLEGKMRLDYIIDCYESKKFSAAFNAGDTYNVTTVTVVDIGHLINSEIYDGEYPILVSLLNKKLELLFL